jgi:FkbM family methyltransferase
MKKYYFLIVRKQKTWIKFIEDREDIMKINFKSSFVRNITHILPLPGKDIRKLLNHFDASIDYPNLPIIVTVKDKYGVFEIRNCREYIQRNIYFLGYYELRETKLFKKILRAGDTFLDVGANIGWFTLVGSRAVGSNGKVVSFEPSSHIYSHLQQTVNINALKNVKVEKLALSDENGIAILSGISADNEGTGSIVSSTKKLEDSAKEEVKTITLDNYWHQENLGKIRLIKIDVEGAELKVLKGAQSLLKEKVCEYIIFEVNDKRLREMGSSSMELLSLVKSLGYDLFSIGTFQVKPLDERQPISFANILAKVK